MADITPTVGQWVVLKGRWGFEAVQVHSITPKLIKHKRYGDRLSQSPRGDVVAVFDDGDDAKALVAAIQDARDSFRAELRSEQDRHDAAMADITERRDAAVRRVIDNALAKRPQP